MHEPLLMPPAAAPPPARPTLAYLGDLMNMIKAFIGTNYLAMPFVFHKAGMWGGVVGIVVVAALTRQGCAMLVRCKYLVEARRPAPAPSSDPEEAGLLALDGGAVKDSSGEPAARRASSVSYGQLGGEILGETGKIVVSSLLVFTQFLFTVGYMIFLSETLVDLVPSLSKPVAVGLFVPPIAALAMIRDVRRLRPASTFANVALLVGVVVVLSVELSRIHRHGTQPTANFRPKGVPIMFGIMTSSFEAAGCLLPVESALEPGRNFSRLLDLTMVLVTSTMAAFSVVGYLAYGDDIKDIVIGNLPNSPALSVLKVCLIIGVLFTYPLQLVPVSRIADRLMRHYVWRDAAAVAPDAADAAAPGSHRLAENVVRVLLVFASASLSLAIPNFHTVSGLVGSMGSAALSYVLPAVFMLTLDKTRPASWRAHDYFLIVFGIVGGCVGTYETIKSA